MLGRLREFAQGFRVLSALHFAVWLANSSDWGTSQIHFEAVAQALPFCSDIANIAMSSSVRGGWCEDVDWA